MVDFDYGAEPVSTGKAFQNPEPGKHAARIRSIIHLGMFQEDFKGKLKESCPQVVVVFELKDDNDVSETGEPLETFKTFPLKKGDKAFLTKFQKAVDPKGLCKGFDDFIGRCVEVTLEGSKELGDDGKPKYVNFKELSELHPKLAAVTDELTVKGAGHVKFADLTRAAIEELHPLLHVADILLSQHNSSYKGSKAEAIVAEIRKDNKEFAVRKAGDAKPAPVDTDEPAAPSKPATPPAELDANEEF